MRPLVSGHWGVSSEHPLGGSKRTGFIVRTFYSFKVKNGDREVCFDSLKGTGRFICSL